MRGTGTLRKSAVITAVCLAVMCVSGCGKPTPEQVAERTKLLYEAIKSDNLERAKLCIKLGANVNAEVYSWEVVYEGWKFTTDKNKVGSNRISRTTLLAYALSTDTNENIVELLIKAGADVNAKDDYPFGCTALMYVINNDQKDIAELLIKAGADVNAKTHDGWTALMGAAGCNGKDVAESLIKAGADVNAKTHDGWTALMMAARCDGKDVAELLIKAGADVNAKTHDGWTALMETASNYYDIKNKKNIAELLIKAGADSDAALKWAVINRASSETKFLIELGANVNAIDSDGLTLLTHAILYGYNDIADLLRAAGAKE